jgi:AcrR family transcriptional regulator
MAITSRDAKRAVTAQRILEAARREFALRGFAGATIRGIASSAGVDPSLVMQHYGSKASLFALAVELPIDDGRVASEHLLDVLGVRLDELPPETRALVRSMLTVPEATDSMKEFLDDRVANLAGSFTNDDAELKALMVVSGILGLTITQHFLKLRAFNNVARDDLLQAAQDWLDALTRAE